MPEQPFVELNDGHRMPQVGLGVYKISNAAMDEVVTHAVDTGYRSVDTAAMYGNERGVGAAVASLTGTGRVQRSDLFITTKLDNDRHGYDEAHRGFDRSLAELGLEHIDLYLIHWPLPHLDRYVDTWRALIDIQQSGRARSIGVSNFQPDHLDRIVGETGVTPAVNQIECHPYLVQEDARAYHRAHGIVTESWSPLARAGELLDATAVTSIADRVGRTPAQVVLRWHLQLGNVVIPKSARPERIESNFALFDFALTDEETGSLNALHRDARTGPHPATFTGR